MRAARESLGKCWPAGTWDHTSKPAGHSPVAAHPAPWETWTLHLAEAGLWATGLSWSSWRPVPEVGSWGTHQRGAAPAPLCSLLTAYFDRPLGSKHHCSYSPQGVGAQPKTPRRLNTSQHKWQQRILDSRVLVTGSTPSVEQPLLFENVVHLVRVGGPCSFCPFSISFSSSLSVFQSWWRPA